MRRLKYTFGDTFTSVYVAICLRFVCRSRFTFGNDKLALAKNTLLATQYEWAKKKTFGYTFTDKLFVEKALLFGNDKFVAAKKIEIHIFFFI